MTVGKNFEYMEGEGVEVKECLVGRLRGAKEIGVSVLGNGKAEGTLVILSEPMFIPSLYFWPIATILIFLTLCCLPLGITFHKNKD